MEIRCCSPPDNSCGKLLALSVKPTRDKTSPMRCSRSAFFFFPVERKTTSKLSCTVCCASNRKSWKTIPKRCRRAGRCFDLSLYKSCSNTEIDPFLIESSPYRVFNKELLPDPTLPII